MEVWKTIYFPSLPKESTPPYKFVKISIIYYLTLKGRVQIQYK